MAVLREALLVEAIVPLRSCIWPQPAFLVGEFHQKYESALGCRNSLSTPGSLAMAEGLVGFAHFLETGQTAFVDARQTLTVVIAAEGSFLDQWLRASDHSKKGYQEYRYKVFHSLYYMYFYFAGANIQLFI